MTQQKTAQSRYYIDGHVHIGRSKSGAAIKIAAAPSLTIDGILATASVQKGIQILGVIDAVTPPIFHELEDLVTLGTLVPLRDGGLRYKDELTLLLGGEIEVRGPYGGAAHFGAFVPDLKALREFAQWLEKEQTNPNLSSQRIKNADANALGQIIQELNGLLIVNHAFTPHKGLYGRCVRHLGEMIDPAFVSAIELGLSADTAMADRLSELAHFTFVTNSDAHSLPRIAREYQIAALTAPTFRAYQSALLRQGENRLLANIGMFPNLGKYHRSACASCHAMLPFGDGSCPACGAKRAVTGVAERLQLIADYEQPHSPEHRPPYIHQVPLHFIPGLGPKLMQKLCAEFGTEMNIINEVPIPQLAEVIGEPLAQMIGQARLGQLILEPGYGGQYGRVQKT
ncbi:endonuclease Q family protein [Sulfoacidibacillus thermotolerans]|uniref:TIGR00375 family protein n=1 Tax=Sulfoacidibacillus thermotolerans TaxID=1765684 RepID=A0A2U3D6R9_SULT2|nr:endonuclease Q family protein [Sulfoacidibacillus thermotolerans]PWI56980.1 hypothetical protein BM613_10880 [Sulfoacidibacillus thermotolerans]